MGPIIYKIVVLALAFFLAVATNPVCHALSVVIAGGTGPMGRQLSSKLNDEGHEVTVLSRNAFLAAAPNRVTGVFGWLGESFLERHPNVRLRDWDGGDLLDIVGQDWVGWQDDALKGADAMVNLVGEYTEQRVMATERIVRESLRVNPTALQIAVSPVEEELRIYSPGAFASKCKRLNLCEDMVRQNCPNHVCLRWEFNSIDGCCDEIMRLIDEKER